MPVKRLLIRGAKQLLTLRGSLSPRRGMDHRQLEIIEDGAVLVEHGTIKEVGPTRRVENLADARRYDVEVIDARGCVVMPGFVDAHMGLPSELTQARDPKEAVLKELEAFLQHGTTTVGANVGMGASASGDVTHDEIRNLRLMALTSGQDLDVILNFTAGGEPPKQFVGRPAAFADWLCSEMLPAIAKKGLARFFHLECSGPMAQALRLDVATAKRCLERAQACKLITRVSFARHARSVAIDFALNAGVVSASHLEHATDADVTAIAMSRAIAVLVPAWGFQADGQPNAPARDLLDYGASVALGSGFSRKVPCRNMQFAIFLACRKLRMTVQEAISAATINAAHALRVSTRVGSIVPGKQADLVCLRVGDYRALGYEFGANLVGMTIKKGEVIFGGMFHREARD